MQRLADILSAPVDRPQILETTALGAAYLAGMQAGFYPDLDSFAARWSLERRFEAQMPLEMRDRKYAGWRDAVSRTLTRRG
jgi:glycerol kinase